MTQHFGVVDVQCTLRSPAVKGVPILALVFGVEIGPRDAQGGNPGVSLNGHISATHHQLAKTINAVINMIQTWYIRFHNGVGVPINIVADVFQAVQLVVNI